MTIFYKELKLKTLI